MAYALKNKVVLITGGANGIGACVVKNLLLEKIKYIAVLDVAEDSGISLQNELNAKYGDNKVKFIKCDVRNEEELFRAFDCVVRDNGSIDLVINNAGIMNDSLKSYRNEIDINITALVTGTIKGLELMRKDEQGEGGTIINISSIAGLCQLPHMPIYWATKAAVIQFSNCIGLDQYYSRTGVRVLTICFGVTDTSLMSVVNMGSFDKNMDKRLENSFSLSRQRTDSAARGLVDVFKHGSSGSTWLVANDKPAMDITKTVKQAYALMAEHVLPTLKSS